jgi:hypothetical protein
MEEAGACMRVVGGPGAERATDHIGKTPDLVSKREGFLPTRILAGEPAFWYFIGDLRL